MSPSYSDYPSSPPLIISFLGQYWFLNPQVKAIIREEGGFKNGYRGNSITTTPVVLSYISLSYSSFANGNIFCQNYPHISPFLPTGPLHPIICHWIHIWHHPRSINCSVGCHYMRRKSINGWYGSSYVRSQGD